MRRVLLVVALALGIGGASCGTLESATGVQRDEKGNVTGTDGRGGIVGTTLDWVIPGAGALIASLAAAYANAKRKQWKEAAIATFTGIEAAAVLAPTVKAKVAEVHQKAGVGEFVSKALKDVGINKG